MKRKIVIATANPGKLRDFQFILGTERYEFLTLKDIGFTDEIIEDGDSFDANALIKVNAVHKFSGLAVLADDSGFCVEALKGAPGVYSARYSDPGATDERNNEKVLRNMEGLENRKAWYHCSLAFKEEDGEEHLFHGQVHGKMLEAPRGSDGFGYDPLFIPENYNETFAELGLAEKKKISHRGTAIQKLFNFLSER